VSEATGQVAIGTSDQRVDYITAVSNEKITSVLWFPPPTTFTAKNYLMVVMEDL